MLPRPAGRPVVSLARFAFGWRAAASLPSPLPYPGDAVRFRLNYPPGAGRLAAPQRGRRGGELE
jgi:hypothetical protein